MKNLKTFILIAFLMVATCSCAQKTLFPALNNQPEISKIFISKSMINMGAKYGTSFGGTNIPEETFKKLNFMEIISSERKSGGEKIDKELNTLINANPAIEILMLVNDDGDNVVIYGTPLPGSDMLSQLMIYTRDSDGDVALIVLDGEINPKDLGVN